MFIDDLCGCNEYLDYAEYQEQIRQILCSGQDNEIHLSMRESTDGWNADYPCTLSILVKDQQAVVNYFSEDKYEIFSSIRFTYRLKAYKPRPPQRPGIYFESSDSDC